ncbi:MAG: tetratricopeptide repeat protein [Myxococcota bacterium]
MGEKAEHEGFFWGKGDKIKHFTLSSISGKGALIAIGAILLGSGAGYFGWRALYPANQPVMMAVKPILPKAQPAADDAAQARKAFAEGKREESVAFFQKATAKSPDDISLLNDFAYVLWQLGRLPEAEDIYQKVSIKDPNCAVCLNNWAMIKVKQDQLLEAERLFNRAIIADASYTEPLFNIAVLYEGHGDLARAKFFYEEFIQKKREKKEGKDEIVAQVKARLEKLNEAH